MYYAVCATESNHLPFGNFPFVCEFYSKVHSRRWVVYALYLYASTSIFDSVTTHIDCHFFSLSLFYSHSVESNQSYLFRSFAFNIILCLEKKMKKNKCETESHRF